MSDPTPTAAHRGHERHQQPAEQHQATGETAAGGVHVGGPTTFTNHGALPPVANGAAHAGASAPSASDRAYGDEQKPGPINSMLPQGVDLQAVRASMVIPGGRKLAGGYTQGGTLRTRDPSEVGVEVTHTGIRVHVSPGLYLDADWPLQDCRIDGAGLDFATKQPYAHVHDVAGLGKGMISIAGKISTKLTDMIHKAVGSTKLVAGNYDPAADPDLQHTLNKVLAGFVDLFAEHDAAQAKTDAEKSPIGTQEMTHVSAGATIAVRDGAKFTTKDGSGLTIDANGPITFAVQGGGNLHDMTGAKDVAGGVDAMNIQSVQMSTEALQILVKGKPVARIESITLERGGKVTIDRMTPLGKLRDAEVLESGFSLLAALVAVQAHDASANDLYRNAQQPQLVDGVSRAMIEKQFTESIHKMIVDYRTAVPGLDLANALAIK